MSHQPGSRPGIGQRVWLLLAGVALLTAGCDSLLAPGAPFAADPSSPAVRAAADAAAAEPEFRAATQALAAAMQHPAVRTAVRDAMRDSPWNAHKIVLQEFLASAEGQTVLAAAAHAAGQQPAVFASRVNALPPLDFYVPRRDDRRRWQATPDLVVVASQNPDAGRFFAFDTSGQEVAVQMERDDGGQVVLLLHPAESRTRRSRPQPRGQGTVIQSPGEGERAATVVWFSPNGDSTVVDLEAVVAGRDPRFTVVHAGGIRKEGTVTPTPLNPSLSTYAYIDYFKLYFGDGAGNVELRFDARFYGPAGDYYGMARYSDNEVPEYGEEYPGLPLIAHMPPVESNARIAIHVWEDDCDCWGNDDDHYGDRDFTWSDRDQTRSIYKDGGRYTNLELNWAERAPSQLARYVLDDLWLEVGWSAQLGVVARDQYGYRLADQQHSVSTWWTDDPYVATATSAGGAYGSVYGNAAGQTRLNAQISGTTTVVSSTVTVDDPYLAPCDPEDPYCLQ